MAVGAPDRTDLTSRGWTHREDADGHTKDLRDRCGARTLSQVRLRNFPCWVMGHMFRVKPGDKEMLVCQRCGKQELLAMKRMRDNTDRPWV